MKIMINLKSYCLYLILFVFTLINMTIFSAASIFDDNNNEDKDLISLRSALYVKDTDKVTKLIKEGINPNVADKSGYMNILMEAALVGNQDIVELLVEAGADVNAASYTNNVLYSAILNRHYDIVKFLLEKSAKVNIVNESDGKTALILAAFYGYKDIATLLIEAGANIDIVDNEDNSALMVAVKNNHKDVVKLLLAAGADLNKVNCDQKSAKCLAVEKGYLEIVELIKHEPERRRSEACKLAKKIAAIIDELLLKNPLPYVLENVIAQYAAQYIDIPLLDRLK